MSDPDTIPDEVCLDKCRCGNTGKFVKSFDLTRESHAAYCKRCGYCTLGHPAQYLAMVEWNKRQRGVA